MLWRVGASSIKEGSNAQMAQALFKIKQVWEYVGQMGLKSDFRYFLDECADLVFEEVTHGVVQPEWKLKEKYLNISGHEEWLKPVTKSLINAYEACCKDKSRPLTYEMYAKFVSACVTWGTAMNNPELRGVEVEADSKTYYKRRDLYTAAQAAKPEDTYEKILRLLQELKGLVETNDKKVDVLYNDRQEQHTAAANQDETWKIRRAEHEETVERRKEEAEREKQRKEDEKALREAANHGVYLER